jgi:hypothetical protein
MMKEAHSTPTMRRERVFVVRVWNEYDAATATVHLRGSVQDGPATERRYFADWQELIGYLAGKIQ